ncbi:MAG: hypothetical protein ACI4XG_29030, partial [Bradyrhizobium sp.]
MRGFGRFYLGLDWPKAIFVSAVVFLVMGKGEACGLPPGFISGWIIIDPDDGNDLHAKFCSMAWRPSEDIVVFAPSPRIQMPLSFKRFENIFLLDIKALSELESASSNDEATVIAARIPISEVEIVCEGSVKQTQIAILPSPDSSRRSTILPFDVEQKGAIPAIPFDLSKREGLS